MSKGKILFIATIHTDINTLMRLLLAKFGYDMIHYNPPLNGKQLNDIDEICKKSKPNVIILANDDFSIPLDQNFCRELRESPYLDGIGLLLVFQREKYRRSVKPDCDTDEYIAFPFAYEELDQRLQALINKSP